MGGGGVLNLMGGPKVKLWCRVGGGGLDVNFLSVEGRFQVMIDV